MKIRKEGEKAPMAGTPEKSIVVGKLQAKLGGTPTGLVPQDFSGVPAMGAFSSFFINKRALLKKKVPRGSGLPIFGSSQAGFRMGVKGPIRKFDMHWLRKSRRIDGGIPKIGSPEPRGTFPYRGFRKALSFGLFVLVAAGFFSAFSFSSKRDFAQMERRARSALESRRWNEALVILEEANRKYSLNPKVRLALAYLYRQLGFLPQARSNANWASGHLNKNKDWAFRELAWICWRMHLYEAALQALAKIEAKKEADAALEARLWIAKGRYERAAVLLKQLPGTGPELEFWRGWCAWMQKDWKAAQAHFEASGWQPARHVFLEPDMSAEGDPWIFLAAISRQSLQGDARESGRRELRVERREQGNRVLSRAEELDAEAQAVELIRHLTGAKR